MKKTDWYPPRVKPVRVGAYQVLSGFYCWWNGRRWSISENSPKKAESMRLQGSVDQHKSWRGLTENPDGGDA